MTKITIDIDVVKRGLENIGYIVTDLITKDNNGVNWQFKFSNSDAVVTVYDSNNKRNSVVNGKCNEEEKQGLKIIVDELKCGELVVEENNKEIVDLINSKKEMTYYDFKREWYSKDKLGSFIHDILCLANNIEHKDSYLIVGVQDDYSVCGVSERKKSNEIYDLLRTIKFAGDNIPDIQVIHAFYEYHKIDVIEIKASKKVPFYITEQYREVFPNHIYTRNGDTNTPVKESANFKQIEELWRYHFET